MTVSAIAPTMEAGAACQRSNVAKRRRAGFSLLEILLALAILGGSLAILSSIADTGVSSAREARDLSVARLLCQNKLSELLLDAMSGISPQSISSAPLESFDSESMTVFNYSVDVQPGQLDGLLVVRVVVVAENPDGGPPLATYSLVRWMVDPTLGLEEAEAEEKAMQEEAAAGHRSGSFVSENLAFTLPPGGSDAVAAGEG